LSSIDSNKVKLFQNSIIYSLVEYEKSKFIFFNSKIKTMNEKTRLNELLLFLNTELNNKIFDTTHEKMFFKNFIGNLNMKKILIEMLLNETSF
jgi:hypothetical protein